MKLSGEIYNNKIDEEVNEKARKKLIELLAQVVLAKVSHSFLGPYDKLSVITITLSLFFNW